MDRIQSKYDALNEYLSKQLDEEHNRNEKLTELLMKSLEQTKI